MARLNRREALTTLAAMSAGLFAGSGAGAADPPKQRVKERPARTKPVPYQPLFPPELPGGRRVVTDTAEAFLARPETLRPGVEVAETPPTIDFLFYPGQDYPGAPWSNWGDGLAANGKYYSAIGDHLAIGVKGDAAHGTGTAFVDEYDPEAKTLRRLVDLEKTLDLPEGHYTPGKIHSRIDLGRDGRLYFSTHRGSEKAASDRNRYEGDWILACDPRTATTEVVAHGPVPKHSLPASVLDPGRLIFYAATAPGPDAPDQGVRLLAYDCERRKVLFDGPDGPSRALMFVASTGRVYYVPGKADGPLMRFDPESPGPPVSLGGGGGLRAATGETPQGLAYAVSQGQAGNEAEIWSLDARTERVRKVGTAAVGTQTYVASIEADPTGRYLYYVPGAHGGGERDGTAVVQFDVATGRKKVIAFLHPFYEKAYGFVPKGTFSTAVSEDGATLFVTWNVSRGTRAWDCCGLTAIRIPESERPA